MSDSSNGNGHTNGHTTSELVLCPGSHEAWAVGFLWSEKLHRVERRELEQNGGVCAACRKQFNRRHAAMQRGEPETPATFDSLRNHVEPENDHLGFADGETVETVDFDFDSIDDLLGQVRSRPEDVREEAARLFAAVMAWVWGGQQIRGAMVKFAALTSGIRPDLIGDKTFLEIGNEIGVSKAAISKQALLFADAFGLKFSRSRQSSARLNMAANLLGRNGEISDIAIRFLERLETANNLLYAWRRIEPQEGWSESTRRRVAAKLKPLAHLHDQLNGDESPPSRESP